MNIIELNECGHMKVLRPPLSDKRRGYVEMVSKGQIERLRGNLEKAQSLSTAYRLPYLYNDSLEIVRIWSVIMPFSSQFLEPLQIAAQASAAMFASIDPRHAQQTLMLYNQPVRYSEPPEQSKIYVGRWVEAFFINLLVKDKDGLDILSQTPLQSLLKSSTKNPEYVLRFAESLQAYWRSDPHTPKKLHSALEATDPETFEVGDPEYAISISVNQMNVLWKILANDPGGFESALIAALEEHKEYWTREERQDDWDGYVSIELSALATLGQMCGLQVDVVSDYLIVDPLRLA